MSAGYESGGYGMINLDGTLTERSRKAGETARRIAANADLLLQAKPARAEAAIVFSPLAPLLGGYDAYGSRTAMHQAVAGYHRMFFERNLPLDDVSSRELDASKLRGYKLVIVPYPLMLTQGEADALKEYVGEGGHLMVEARPGWVDERGHAEEVVPGFGWKEMLGVREKTLVPGAEFPIKWGTAEFMGMSMAEKFEVLNPAARVVATTADGSPIAYENKYKKGSAIIVGSFVGQENQLKPVEEHPLAGILAEWAGLSSLKLKASSFVEVREMEAPGGRLIFFFNHGEAAAKVEFERDLEKPVVSMRELITSREVKVMGTKVNVNVEVPAESVRIYRIGN